MFSGPWAKDWIRSCRYGTLQWLRRDCFDWRSTPFIVFVLERRLATGWGDGQRAQGGFLKDGMG
jgi:hypothetical protein